MMRAIQELLLIFCAINLVSAVVEFRCASRRANLMPNDCSVNDLTITKNNPRLNFLGPADESKKIEKFHIQNSKFEILPAQIFRIFPKLNYLSVFQCDLDGRLDDNLFKDASQILSLFLRRNQIAQISENSFAHLTNTKIISLSSNELENLPEILFKNNRKLRIVDLDGNRLSQLSPNTFKNNRELTHVNLSHNKLKTIHENLLATLETLQSVFLGHNQLDTLPENLFRNNPNLDYISLDNNRITKLSPNTFKNLNKLEMLYLIDNECVSQGTGQAFSVARANEILRRCYQNWR